MLAEARRRIATGLSLEPWLPIIDSSRRGEIILTFDDGPSPAATPRILRLLEQYSAHATFFMLGKRAERWPELVLAVAQAGHPIYAHGYSHDRLDEVSSARFLEELDRAEAALSAIRPTPSPYLVRLPYGAGHHSPDVHRRLRAWRPDCQVVHWRYDTKDFLLAEGCASEEDLVGRCRAAVETALAHPRISGSVVLMHEDPYGVDAPLAASVGPLLLEQFLLHGARVGLDFGSLTSRKPPISIFPSNLS